MRQKSSSLHESITMTGHLIRHTSSSPTMSASFGIGLVAHHQQQQVAKSFYCVFCRDIASLRMGDFAQFQQHMEGVHRVHYEYDILLAVNFIERAEKDAIIERVKRKVGGGGEEERQVQCDGSFRRDATCAYCLSA